MIALATFGSDLLDTMQSARRAVRENPEPARDDLPAARAVRLQIAALVALHDNPDTTCERYAVEAAAAGLPAFWKRTKYHNAVVGLVCTNVNAGGDLSAELTNWCDDSRHGNALEVLRQLIPLNVRADVVLREAIARAEWGEAERRNIERS